MFKKILSILFSVVFAAAFVEAAEFDFLMDPVKINAAFINTYEANIKAGYSFNGFFYCEPKFQGLESSDFKTENSFSFAAEFFKYIDTYVAVGAGASYQIAGSFEDLKGKIGFAPVYFALKVRSWPQQPGLYGYATGHIGYNFFYGDSVFADNFKINGGGLYYAFGFGIVYTDYIFECLYGFHNGKVSDLSGGLKDTPARHNLSSV